MDDYLKLLDKAREQLPENQANHDRWTLPVADLIKEGRMTVFRNFRDIVNGVRRDEVHLSKYLLSQIGTAGQLDGDRLIFTGKVGDSQVMGRLNDYVATYVRCPECGAPDTKLGRDGRVQMLHCEACGSASPVKARKGASKAKGAFQMKEGAEVEVTIKRQGTRKEGLGEVDGYTVIVPKTAAGVVVKVRITRIAGKMAFAEAIE
jgi:translation initiation factor 2 subunit 2